MEIIDIVLELQINMLKYTLSFRSEYSLACISNILSFK
jgi:hypothetical protein